MKNLIMQTIKNLFNYFDSGATLCYSHRVEALKKLYNNIKLNEKLLLEALKSDLNKPEIESYASEIGILYTEIKYILKHLKKWMKPQKVSSKLVLFYSRSYIYKVPLGIVLVISPWNYPVILSLLPLIGAISGGNCVVLKPSEFTPNVNVIITKIIHETFNNNQVAIIEDDGSTIIPELLNNYTFNHVFFTGSTNVGKIIATMCATKLIPYTLELGGKSPAIVEKSANLKVIAKRIIWAKFYNAGQTCIAPDYVLVDKEVKNSLVNWLIYYIKEFYTKEGNLARIINTKRFNQLKNLLQNHEIIYGGESNSDNLMIEPTLVNEPSLPSLIMQEEIFGPILPIVSYTTDEELEQIISINPNPLALYVFSENHSFIDRIIHKVQFGGGGVNVALLHIINHNLPFGGVMSSGNGNYHGKFSFDNFTHEKSVIKMPTFFDAFIKYPPYSRLKSSLLKLLF